MFNESEEEAIYPTPIIGSVGVLNNINKLCTMEFKDEGDFIFILGSDKTYDYGNCLSGSEYMKFFFDTFFLATLMYSLFLRLSHFAGKIKDLITGAGLQETAVSDLKK